MRGARVLLTPTEWPYKSTGKTVGRFACRGFRPPPLAMDWGHGEAKPKYVSKRATIRASSSSYGFPYITGYLPPAPEKMIARPARKTSPIQTRPSPGLAAPTSTRPQRLTSGLGKELKASAHQDNKNAPDIAKTIVFRR